MLRLSQLFNFLFFLWADGGPKPTTGNSGDTGSILDPNG
jgi:hypothetical protein